MILDALVFLVVLISLLFVIGTILLNIQVSKLITLSKQKHLKKV